MSNIAVMMNNRLKIIIYKPMIVTAHDVKCKAIFVFINVCVSEIYNILKFRVIDFFTNIVC